MANWVLYDNFRKRQFNTNHANLDAGGDGVKCALITSAVAPSQANDVTWNAPVYVEVVGTNYVAGGLAVNAGQSIGLSAGVVTWLTSTAFSWAQSNTGFTNARYAVLYDTTNNTLIAYGDLGGNFGNTVGAFQITGPATSIFTSP